MRLCVQAGGAGSPQINLVNAQDYRRRGVQPEGLVSHKEPIYGISLKMGLMVVWQNFSIFVNADSYLYSSVAESKST